MAQVAAEVEELYLYARNLRNMAEALSNNYSQLRNQTLRIDETWKDQENRVFMEDFVHQADYIYKISEKMEEYGQFINKKADKLQNYLDTRL